MSSLILKNENEQMKFDLTLCSSSDRVILSNLIQLYLDSVISDQVFITLIKKFKLPVII